MDRPMRWRVIQNSDESGYVVEHQHQQPAGRWVEDYTLTAEELEELLVKDSGKTREINVLVKENRDLTAEVARLRGALEEIYEGAAWKWMGGYGEEAYRIARDALAREEPVAREVCPYCMTSTGGEVRNPDCPVHGFQPLAREENPSFRGLLNASVEDFREGRFTTEASEENP